MGCFNHKGNFSQLPIAYGDRVVVIIGVSHLESNPDNFSPGCSFVPISVPIRGKYNDYGGIENVDRTPAIDVLENYFGLDVYKIVDFAERTCCGCEDQMENEKEKVNKILNELNKHYNFEELKLSYIMEHEQVFDYLVSTGNPKKKEKEFWRIPHKYIEALGYEKTVTGKHNGYEHIDWKHKTLSPLKENCYVWLENDFGKFDKVSHTISELCEKIGCVVPEEFNEGFLESCFKKDLNAIKLDEDIFDEDTQLMNYSFRRDNFRNGLFSYRTGLTMQSNILSQFGNFNEHIDQKYMKEVVEIAAIINALQELEMTWGVTNYYRQDVDYNQHIGFLNECLNVAKSKKEEHEVD